MQKSRKNTFTAAGIWRERRMRRRLVLIVPEAPSGESCTELR